MSDAIEYVTTVKLTRECILNLISVFIRQWEIQTHWVYQNGKLLIEFATFNNMRITNTFFKHRNIHKYTWSQRGTN
jgi:hypothetical protein